MAYISFDRELAERLRAQGNDLFHMQQWLDAAASYEEALRECSKAPLHPDACALQIAISNNLAQTFLNAKLPQRAVSAASSCLSLDPGNQAALKALLRRAKAFVEIGQDQEALNDVEAALLINTSSKPLLDMKEHLLVRLGTNVAALGRQALPQEEQKQQKQNDKNIKEDRADTMQMLRVYEDWISTTRSTATGVKVPTKQNGKCDNCGARSGTSTKLSLCSKCGFVAYCSSACQHAHWPEHKGLCKARCKASEASPMVSKQKPVAMWPVWPRAGAMQILPGGFGWWRWVPLVERCCALPRSCGFSLDGKVDVSSFAGGVVKFATVQFDCITANTLAGNDDIDQPLSSYVVLLPSSALESVHILDYMITNDGCHKEAAEVVAMAVAQQAQLIKCVAAATVHEVWLSSESMNTCGNDSSAIVIQCFSPVHDPLRVVLPVVQVGSLRQLGPPLFDGVFDKHGQALANPLVSALRDLFPRKGTSALPTARCNDLLFRFALGPRPIVVETSSDTKRVFEYPLTSSDEDGRLPELLHVLAKASEDRIAVPKVQSLLDRGVVLGEIDADGWTAMHYAAYRGLYSIANLLLQRSAAADEIEGTRLHTPLHIASLNGGCEPHDIVAQLLTARAMLLRNRDGHSALDYAHMRLAGKLGWNDCAPFSAVSRLVALLEEAKTSALQVCAKCGSCGARLQTCGRCGLVAYHGQCQKRHWKSHKLVCYAAAPLQKFEWSVNPRTGAIRNF